MLINKCLICFKIKKLNNFHECKHKICKSCFNKWNKNCPSCRANKKKKTIVGINILNDFIYDS